MIASGTISPQRTTRKSLYVDGKVEAQRPLTDTPVANEADIVLGQRFNNSAPVQGVIDELGLFKVGLTAAEVNEVMNDGLDAALGLTAVSAKGKLAATWGVTKMTML